MKKTDPALIFSNPRILATIYYGLLSVVGTILINAFLTIIGVKEMVPLFQAILLGMVVASLTGALFGKGIIYCEKPYMAKTFLLGFIMVIVSLPFFDLGLVLFMDASHNKILPITNVQDLITAYVIVLGYSYFLFGFFLAIASGFASMYLRDKLVYHVLHTDRHYFHSLPRYIAARRKTIRKTMRKPPALHQKKL